MAINDVQVGEEVVVSGGMVGSQERIETVSKVSKTRITISCGTQFTRMGGRKIGGGSFSAHIYQPDEGEIARIREREKQTLLWAKVDAEFERTHS